MNCAKQRSYRKTLKWNPMSVAENKFEIVDTFEANIRILLNIVNQHKFTEMVRRVFLLGSHFEVKTSSSFPYL